MEYQKMINILENTTNQQSIMTHVKHRTLIVQLNLKPHC